MQYPYTRWLKWSGNLVLVAILLHTFTTCRADARHICHPEVITSSLWCHTHPLYNTFSGDLHVCTNTLIHKSIYFVYKFPPSLSDKTLTYTPINTSLTCTFKGIWRVGSWLLISWFASGCAIHSLAVTQRQISNSMYALKSERYAFFRNGSNPRN